MKTAKDKAEMLRQQVNAKVLWGASDCEVLDWLQERHGITGAAADDLLAAAHHARRASVRSKAVIYLVFSTLGMLMAVVFVVLQSMGRFIVVGYGSVLVIVVGLISLGIFVRSLFRLFTGETQGPVD